MNGEMQQHTYNKNMECMEQMQNSVVVDGSYPSRNEQFIQEWTPLVKNPNEEIPNEPLDNRTKIVQTFDIPNTNQLRYGGDLELKLGNKIQGFLELLQKGAVIGDGNYSQKPDVSSLQELVLEHSDKLGELHANFLEAGSDVLQAMTVCPSTAENSDIEVKKLNETACKVVCKMATEHGFLVAGAICPSADYMKGMDKEHVQTYFKEQMVMFKDCKVDVCLCDMFAVEETEWALEVLKTSGVPIVVTLCVDKLGTASGTSLGDYAIRMAKAGADVVGVCCKFDGQSSEDITEYVQVMKAALDRLGLQRYIMSCPHGSSMQNNHHHSHDIKNKCFESKPLEKSDVETHARALYEAGVRFFRAGCGLGTSYIQHISNELMKERAKIPINIKSSGHITMDKYQPIRKGSKTYWNSVISPSGTNFTLPETA